MRKGIVIIRPPLATPELQKQLKRRLENDDWTCELRTRFDGTMAVAFERGPDLPESTLAEVEHHLAGHILLSAANLEIKELG